MKKAVVTGGCGFIGAYLVRALVHAGWSVSVVDNNLRGDLGRLASVKDDIHYHGCDIRDAASLTPVFRGADVVFHLAAVNGTENFYNQPELVLDVGVRGALAVVDACRQADVVDLVVASSAEVYQTPAVVPTDETIALMLPDSLNPRYSYGGSKIVSELIAFNYGQDHFNKVQVFRPHNIYGPDMGYKHVVPQFITRALDLIGTSGRDFQIRGNGSETRAFCYVDDVVNGIIRMYEAGADRNIYHIGNDQMIQIGELALMVGDILGMELALIRGEAPSGETSVRCPSIEKMKNLGYSPEVGIREGLEKTINWYRENPQASVENALL